MKNFKRSLLSASGHLLRFILGLLITGWIPVSAQSNYSFCQPELVHYTRQSYGAYNQNWGAAQHPKTRFIYFANSKGLLEFDGSNWKVYELPRKQRVRSVAIDSEGRIFTGALGEFGYWFPGTNGVLTYHSLVPLIGEKQFLQEEIWNILITKQGVLFQSFAFVYRYEQGRMHFLPPPATILFIHSVHDRLLLEVMGKGLYELKGQNYKLINGSEFLGRETVTTILPLGDQKILVGTDRTVYSYDGSQFRPFNQQLNRLLQHDQLNRGVLIKQDLYAFGTLLNGVFITNADGQIRYHLNQKTGLQNNTVLSLRSDVDGNLWAGLDKGIDMINLSSPVRYFSDIDGNLGTPYDIARYGNTLYLGTNQGVYQKSLEKPDTQFSLIQGTQGQVWDLAVVDNQLLCGHNKGTFRIEGTQAQLLSNVTGGWVLDRMKKHPDKLIQGTYTSLCLYQKDQQGKWTFLNKVSGFQGPVRQLNEDDSGNIWVNKASNLGLQRIRLSDDLTRAVAVTDYGSDKIHGSALNLCRVQKRIIVTSTEGLQLYDEANDRFVPASRIYPWAENNIRKIFPMTDSSLFLLRQDGTVGWTKTNGRVSADVPVQTNQWVEDYEKIADLDADYVAFCRENGFALVPRNELQRPLRSVPAPVIRMITTVDEQEERNVFWGTQSGTTLSFAHDQSNLLITFSTPYYTQPVKYSYWLENSTRAWSPLTTSHQKEFNSLPPGHYVFHLKSNLSPVESTLSFEIRPPWFWTTWSKLVYLILLTGFCGLLYVLHLRRVDSQQKRLKKRMETKLRRQEEKSQREIILLQKEQLEQGLIQKSEELANSTMVLIQKNELLLQLKEELNKTKTKLNGRLPSDDFGRINTLIDTNISSEQDWKIFETNFNKVHEQFLKRLFEQYPDLGQGDLKLAAYLRMNLSTKEIAQLLNITHRSVELKRYRLRKKLNLEADTNLSEFMIKY
ncbi:hypothetical protein GCM10027592_51250 [Spirosoma flavus]